MATETTIAFAAILLLSGCALCPSMDDNCWLVKEMNGQNTGPARLTPEEQCNANHGKVVLKAGEFYECQ